MFAVLDGFADPSKIPAEVLNVLEQPASLRVEPLQTLLDLIISTPTTEKVLEEEKNRNLCKPVVNRVVETPDKKDRGRGTVKYSSTEELLLKFIEKNSGSL